MSQTWHDALTLLAFGIATGGMGYWLHDTVERARMRRVLARVHAEINRRHED